MRRILIFIAFASICIINFKCSKTDGIFMPITEVTLSFPTNNLLCTDNTITFDWSDVNQTGTNSTSYTFIIAKDRALTDVVENTTTTQSEITVTLEKETAYYWKVIVLDAQNDQELDSEVFAFFTKGLGIVNYAPFASQLVSPTNESLVNTGTVDLMWIGSDTNSGDTLTYELFFGESSTPTLIVNSLTEEVHTVSIKAGKTYYWKVNVIDQNNAKSIGQIWSFTAN
jgi:hypothetical protein